MSNVVYVYGDREGVGVRGFKMFCQKGQNFFYLLCVCVCVAVGGGGGGGGGQVQYLSFREKITDPPPNNK